MGQVKVTRWQAGSRPAEHPDDLAVEEPLEIRVDSRPISVTMRTPGHDDELAAGFLLTEGLVRRRADIAKIQRYPRNEQGNVVNVFLSPDVAVDFARLTRHVFASSSCGLCGKATIDAVHQHFKPIKTKMRVTGALLASLPELLRREQPMFTQTGGLHAAAIFDARGRLVVLREDVGRHNAVDKVLGRALLDDSLPLNRHILLVSGRASFEIQQKALAARVPIVAAVSAPSSLAVEFARASGQTLVGFLRGERMNVYSRPERIKF
ncbi:MAG: formate dehydrogenase accessory sulfurtransferase FdhD [Verrucomicrobia bacterium]|nr:formate dehydrogenase accessory sulfurtransferase FdhD [Verrucomicrobiota bacterium]